MLSRLEACGKPVVAALHGATLGGGAETALACHYRCAAGDLQLGFPEVSLGLLPGAGGTVRLPRLAGWQAAFELMASGKPIGIERRDRARPRRPAHGRRPARRCDRLGARTRRGAGAAAARLGTSGAALAPAQFEEYLRILPPAARRLPAPPRIVEALASTAMLPVEAALARARALFLECLASTESRALRHLFFAERARRRIRSSRAPVDQAAVLGAGTMGSGIAISLATGGIAVTLIDAKQEALDAGLARARAAIDAAERKGRLDAEAAAARAAASRGR